MALETGIGKGSDSNYTSYKFATLKLYLMFLVIKLGFAVKCHKSQAKRINTYLPRSSNDS